MKTKVIKIGGSCLSSSGDIKKIVKIINNEEDLILVVSAFKNVTNLIEYWFYEKDERYLIELRMKFKKIFEELFIDKNFKNDFTIFNEIVDIHKNNISFNHAQSLGEKVSSYLIEMYLRYVGVSIEMSQEDPLVFGDNDSFDLTKSSKKILDFFRAKKHKHILTQGFASIDSKGQLNNLNREGSDLTAIIWAYSLDAECILYKDVGAIYTDDPNKNKNSKKISEINFYDYKERFYKSKVIQDRVVDFCLFYKIPISIYSFNTGNCGTKLFF